MNEKTVIVLVMIAAYLLGNISPSTLIGKSKGIDIKKAGSGNAGTTNALRVLGKKAAVLTLLIDVGKGAAAVLLASHFLPHRIAVYSVLAVFLGHIWPVLFRFKGGKGVATAFGASLVLDWRVSVTAAAVFILCVLITKMVSLGSLFAAVAFLAATWSFVPEFIPGAVIMFVIIVIKHRSNIARLMRGEENKISFKKKEK